MHRYLIVLAAGALAACASPEPEPPAEREKSGLETRLEMPRTTAREVEAAQAAAQARIDSQMAEVAGDTTPP